MSITIKAKKSFIHFKLETKNPISREDAAKLQAENGFDLKKNGLYAFVIEKIYDRYEITWACRA